MTLQSIAKSLSSFIKKAAQNPLWTFGWMVFVASISFTVNFFVDYPNQLAQMDGNSARFNTYTQDYDESLQVVQIVRDSNKSFLEVIEQYNAISKKLANNENVSYEEVGKALSKAKETRIFLTVSLGTLRGISFNNASLDKYVQDFSRYISDKERFTVTVINFYEGSLSEDKQKVTDAVAKLQDYSVSTYGQASEETERFKNFMDEFENFNSENMIEINKETNKLVVYQWKSTLVVAAMAYSIIFLITAAFTWVKKSGFMKASISKGKPKKKK